jgi:hypothetical protein
MGQDLGKVFRLNANCTDLLGKHVVETTFLNGKLKFYACLTVPQIKQDSRNTFFIDVNVALP